MEVRELVGDAKGVPTSEKVKNHWHIIRVGQYRGTFLEPLLVPSVLF